VFNQPRVAETLHHHFIPVKIDATQHPELAAKYRVNSVPRDVIITADQEEIHRLFTPQDPDQYVAQLSAVAFRSSTKATGQSPASPSREALASARSPSSSALPPMKNDDARFASRIGADMPQRDAYAAHRQLNEHSLDTTVIDAPADAGASEYAEPREVINRYASRNRREPSPSEGRSEASRQLTTDPQQTLDNASDPSSQGDNAVAEGNKSRWGSWDQPRETFAAREPLGQTAAASAPADRGADTPAATSPARPMGTEQESALASTPASRNPITPREPLAKATATRPAARDISPASPPSGLDGYCPVSLHRDNNWVKGDLKHGVIHRGRTYLFATEKEKQLFFADPDEYSPVLAGIDPVLLTDRGQAVEGARAHGVVYRKRIYLFSSEENLERFWQEPERYASPIRQAMEAGDVNRLFR
jgi:YHS domain-containing protein